jgi:hypothetical protein
MLIAFSRQQLFANASQCYVIRTLSVLLIVRSVVDKITTGLQMVEVFEHSFT